ncbi:ABC transporter ATP-binding protein [Petroclostridium sp. X23]|uniref:ABC transporter ATP-binding protein n=1 Tax=Petroclostridium sp. X23 TaxID=3045146 RepID=UPI0024AE07E2|nr:ABC transporter ATP-binding protein [Petroclostridium sp. X23]WHH59359.1 ABC transporter ATP-binding protein [Petroclostridium sp. X23]
MTVLLEAKNVTKSYFGKKALDGVNLKLDTGKILGLMGPNGSGKTTFMKIAAGLQHPSSGELLIAGHTPGLLTKSIVSFLPDTNQLYHWMKTKDAVDYFHDFFNDFDLKKCMEMLQFMKLDMNSSVKSLSKGMLEKLNLSLILSRKAKLYIIDEPLGGVDPVSREQIIDSILNTYREDSSLMISTHLVNDIERLFDEIAFISAGSIVLTGNAEDLRYEHSKSIDALYREVFQNA